MLYIPGGLIVMIAPNDILTPLLRMVHGVEILGDFVVYAAVLTFIFRPKESRENKSELPPLQIES